MTRLHYNMDSSDTLNRMASYDFKAPINVVCFEEENSGDQIDLTSSPKSKDEDSVLYTEVPVEYITDEMQLIDKTNTSTKKKRSIDKNSGNNKRKKNSEANQSSQDKTDLHSNNINDINDDLRTVSKYLTLIMESYHQYHCTLNNKKSTYDDKVLSKRSFMTIKLHFFQAAYEQVNKLIMPNESKKQFISRFLNHTCKMASERLKSNCNTGISEIYFEMMEWVKQKNYENSIDNNNVSILRKQLNDPPIVSSLQTSVNVGQDCSTNADPSQLCIFSSGPPRRKINNIDKSLVPYKNVIDHVPQPHQNVLLEQNQITSHQNRLPMNANTSFKNTEILQNTYGNSHIYQESVIRRNTLSQPVGLGNEYFNRANSTIPTYQPSPNYYRNMINENNQVYHNTHSKAYYRYFHTPNSNYETRGNYYAPNSVIHHVAQMPSNTVVNEELTLRTFRNHHNPQRLDMCAPPPPPYHAPSVEQPNQVVSMTQAPSVQSVLSSAPDLTRSSVSTDSGFISPVRSKSSSNPLEDIMNDLLELEKMVQPTKSTAETVICHVCHKKSSLMCSACSKTNYCSTKCQRIDWDAHRILCQAGISRQ